MSRNHRVPLCQVVLPDGISWPCFLWHNILSVTACAHGTDSTYMPTVCFFENAPLHCKRRACKSNSARQQTPLRRGVVTRVLKLPTARGGEREEPMNFAQLHTYVRDTFTYQFVPGLFFPSLIPPPTPHTWTLCIHTLTNRK